MVIKDVSVVLAQGAGWMDRRGSRDHPASRRPHFAAFGAKWLFENVKGFVVGTMNAGVS
jgi:hypothetical protein